MFKLTNNSDKSLAVPGILLEKNNEKKANGIVLKIPDEKIKLTLCKIILEQLNNIIVNVR